MGKIRTTCHTVHDFYIKKVLVIASMTWLHHSTRLWLHHSTRLCKNMQEYHFHKWLKGNFFQHMKQKHTAKHNQAMRAREEEILAAMCGPKSKQMTQLPIAGAVTSCTMTMGLSFGQGYDASSNGGKGSALSN